MIYSSTHTNTVTNKDTNTDTNKDTNTDTNKDTNKDTQIGRVCVRGVYVKCLTPVLWLQSL